MSNQYVQRLLFTSNLGLDPTITASTQKFLVDNIGTLSPESRDYSIFAAAALMGEVATITNMKNQVTKSGITVQSIMRHIGNHSREEFLEVLTNDVLKWREAPHWLKQKIVHVKLSYRMYKKYSNAFQRLAALQKKLNPQETFQLMAIFWVLYLFVKNSNNQFDSADEALQLLHALFLLAFTKIISDMDAESVTKIAKNLPFVSDYEFLSKLIVDKLKEVYMFRYENQDLNPQQLVKDNVLRQRYLDDIGNQYDRFATSLPENHIDQISFLRLDKTLTPLSIVRTPELNPIKQKIDFNADDDDDMDFGMDQQDEEGPGPSSIQQMFSFTDKLQPRKSSGSIPFTKQQLSPCRKAPSRVGESSISPISLRLVNIDWVNKLINAKNYQKDVNQVRQLYQKNTGKSYEEYQTEALLKVKKAINEFSPSCRDSQKRQNKIYLFFIHFVQKIAEQHQQQERNTIFQNIVTFNSIFCLATNIINYALNALNSSYQEYCDIFGVCLIDGHKPINWFGLKGDMPKNLQAYLYDLQRKILVQQIWQSDVGYELIRDNHNNQYSHQAFLKRLKQHVDQRTQQLCNSMKVAHKQMIKVVNLVRHIIQNKQMLLYKHKIDQIIVCSIASILSINQSRINNSLDQIFRHYNNLIHSFNTNRHDLFDSQGNQIDLFDFYNKVFLPCVDDIVNNQEQTANILNTPVRIQRRQNQEKGIPLIPVSVKFEQKPVFGSHGSKMVKTDVIYRAGIVKSFQKLQIENNEQQQEQNYDDKPSPRFGGSDDVPKTFSKTFSFRDQF